MVSSVRFLDGSERVCYTVEKGVIGCEIVGIVIQFR